MVTVKSQKELKRAIKAKESPIVPGNRRMALTLSIVTAIFALTTKDGKRPSAKEIVAFILGNQIGGAEVCALTEEALLAIVFMSLVAAVAIVAICLGQEVTITWDEENRVFKLGTKKRKDA